MKKRFRQFSLRAFFFAVTAVSLLLAVWTYRARSQQHAVQVIVDVGGRVTYDSGSWTSKLIPNFLVDKVGADYFHSVRGITFYPESNESADEQIKLLSGLHDLQFLAIWPGCKGRTSGVRDAAGGLSDVGAEYLLEHHRSLKSLSLLSARLSDEACEKLMGSSIATLQLDRHSDYNTGRGFGRD